MCRLTAYWMLIIHLASATASSRSSSPSASNNLEDMEYEIPLWILGEMQYSPTGNQMITTDEPATPVGVEMGDGEPTDINSLGSETILEKSNSIHLLPADPVLPPPVDADMPGDNTSGAPIEDASVGGENLPLDLSVNKKPPASNPPRDQGSSLPILPCVCPSTSTAAVSTHLPRCPYSLVRSQLRQQPTTQRSADGKIICDGNFIDTLINFAHHDRFILSLLSKRTAETEISTKRKRTGAKDPPSTTAQDKIKELIAKDLRDIHRALDMDTSREFKKEILRHIELLGYYDRKIRVQLPIYNYILLMGYYISLPRLTKAKQPLMESTYIWAVICSRFLTKITARLPDAMKLEPYSTYIYLLGSSMENEKEYLKHLSDRITARRATETKTVEVPAAFEYFDRDEAKPFEETITNFNAIVSSPKYRDDILNTYANQAEGSNPGLYFTNIFDVLVSETFTKLYFDMLKSLRNLGKEYEEPMGIYDSELTKILADVSNGLAQALARDEKGEVIKTPVADSPDARQITQTLCRISKLSQGWCEAVDELELPPQNAFQIKFTITNTLMATINMVKALYLLADMMKGVQPKQEEIYELSKVLGNILFSLFDGWYLVHVIEEIASSMGKKIGSSALDLNSLRSRRYNLPKVVKFSGAEGHLD